MKPSTTLSSLDFTYGTGTLKKTAIDGAGLGHQKAGNAINRLTQ